MSDLLIRFFIPTHRAIFLAHFYIKAIGPAFTHAGFEQVVVGDRELVAAGDFHHQFHHRFFECNYGTADRPGVAGVVLFMTALRRRANGLDSGSENVS